MNPVARRLVLAAAAAVAVAVPTLAPAQGAPSPLRDLPARATAAIVGVSVVPMDREGTLPNHTVVVRDGRVVAIGPAASTPVPAGAARIDGRGKFLVPGLIDMHAHLVGGDESLATGAGRQLALSLANGVTTLRGLGGAPTAFALRDRIARGELLAPSMIVPGQSLNGNTVKSPAEAVQKVEAAKAAGAELLKTHGNFASGEIYDSIVVAARRAGLPLAGHVTPEYGLRKAMDAGQQLEHFDGVIAAVTRDGAPSPPPGQIVVEPQALANVDPAKLAALAAEMASRKLWNGPTLALFEILASDETPEQLAAREEMRYAPAAGIAQWKQQKQGFLDQAPAEGRARFLALRREIARAYDAAGAKLLAGSDSPQLFMTPGFGLHRELAALEAAGLPPRRVLAAATSHAAEYLGRADIGTIRVGGRADLLLVDADPLAAIGNLRRVAGVMADGRWVPAARLDAMKEAVAAEVAKIK
jgi:imidazolonepropionase-like amidohydrolase